MPPVGRDPNTSLTMFGQICGDDRCAALATDRESVDQMEPRSGDAVGG